MTKTLHRFFVHPAAIKEDKVVIRDKEQIHQLTRVLRMKVGTHLIVLNNKGREIEVQVTEMSKKKITCRFVEERTNQNEPAVSIRLFQGLTKQASKFEEVLKHGTELGVTEFYPLLTQNGEAQELRKRERMEHILKEAAEQSERGRIPILGNEVRLASILEKGWPEELNADVTLLAYAREKDTLLSDVIRQLGSPKTINLIIGPEGGFTEEEVQHARDQHFMVFGLGPRVLRTETAGVAVVAALLLN
jgi:16S rRNA (uracil1498-N3)-methyltransferase